MLLVVFKILLTIPVACALAWPWVNPLVAGGIFSELEALGSIGASILTLVFLNAVFFYCRDLQRSLTLGLFRCCPTNLVRWEELWRCRCGSSTGGW
ncbi:hypothetical protein [Pseudomonas helvetica]|uniref:hypothetical protein n=1 Tax=Pseudomonas helvetica TaxID=3136738 RepID=UPI003264B1D1